MEVDKFSYEKGNKFGNVTVSDGKKMVYEDLKEIRIIAGLHNVHRFDFVMRRTAPFKDSKVEKYALSILDTVQFDTVALVRLQFEGGGYEGTLYINSENFAVHRGDYQTTKSYSEKGFSAGNRIFLKFTTEYSQFEGKYRLRYIHYQTAFDQSPRIYLSNRFSINYFSANNTTIAYADQAAFTEQLLKKVPYATLSDSSRIADTLNNSSEIEKSKVVELLKFLLTPRTMLGGQLIFLQRNEYQAILSEGGLSETFSRAEAGQRIFAVSTMLNYRINNALGVNFEWVARSPKYSQLGLGLEWNRPLTKNSRLKGFVSTQIGHRKIREELGEIQLATDTKLAGENFEAGALGIYSEQRGWFLSPSIGLRYRLSGLISLQAKVQTYFGLDNETGIHLREGNVRSNRFKDERVYESNPSFLVSPADDLFEDYISVSFGIGFGF